MKHFFKYVLIFGYAIIALACSQSKEPTGKATFTGKFAGSFPVGQIYTVKIAVPNLILGMLQQFDEYETQLEPDGSFSLSVPLFSPVYAMLSINEEDQGAVFLSPDKEAKIELSLNEVGKMQVKFIGGKGLTPEDLNKTNRLFMEFIQKVFDPNSLSGLRYDMSPEEYRDYILNWTEEQISIILNEAENLPENQKQLITQTMKWNTYIGYLFNYENQVCFLYEKQRGEKKINDRIFTLVKPDKSYYSFLRFFDLNNPPLGNPISYSRIYQHILADSVLNIPSINDQPLSDWLKEVKIIMEPLVGFDASLFYDFLALHAYRQQFEESKPLSDKQKEDINAYFKNPTFVKFLFTENDKAIKQSKLSSLVRETPKVKKEKVMEAIVSQYKGKEVVVDFWATWCEPCMQAMKEIEPIKEELQGKNVVFVYIAEPSSPVELWKKKILGIDGEHYYLNQEEKDYVKDAFDLNAIPTYLIFDSTGKLKNKITGYPGNDEMRKMIEQLLP